MENVFKYYDFTSFSKDTSGVFSGNEICYTELNKTHFLIFESILNQYNLYVARYQSKYDIGKNQPEIIEVVVKDYNKDIPEHRVALKRYFE